MEHMGVLSPGAQAAPQAAVTGIRTGWCQIFLNKTFFFGIQNKIFPKKISFLKTKNLVRIIIRAL